MTAVVRVRKGKYSRLRSGSVRSIHALIKKCGVSISKYLWLNMITGILLVVIWIILISKFEIKHIYVGTFLPLWVFVYITSKLLVWLSCCPRGYSENGNQSFSNMLPQICRTQCKLIVAFDVVGTKSPIFWGNSWPLKLSIQLNGSETVIFHNHGSTSHRIASNRSSSLATSKHDGACYR